MQLIPVEAEHAELLQRWREGEAAKKFNPMRPTDMRKKILEYGRPWDREKNEFRWMIELDGRVVGQCGVKNVGWDMGHGEIAYMMDPEFHGRGICGAAVRMLVEKLFAETDLHRLYATIHPENEPSIRIVKRLGFVEEGRLREHWTIAGRKVDEVVFGLLRREWYNRADEK